MPGAGQAPSSANPGPPAAAAGAPVTTVALMAGCTPVAWPGADGLSVIEAVLGISPAGAQQTATVWRRTNGEWQAWAVPAELPREPFPPRRGEQPLVCVSQAGTWSIPTMIGGP